VASDVRVVLEIDDLPGPSWDGYENIHVGVQRGKEIVGVTPATEPSAAFAFEVTVHNDGDVRGPWVQGKRGDRFVYITWGTSSDSDAWGMFRRAKVMLEPASDALSKAARTGATVRAKVAGTDSRGGPTCAALRPPRIAWSLDV
jgi:hypothetical protein